MPLRSRLLSCVTTGAFAAMITTGAYAETLTGNTVQTASVDANSNAQPAIVKQCRAEFHLWMYGQTQKHIADCIASGTPKTTNNAG